MTATTTIATATSLDAMIVRSVVLGELVGDRGEHDALLDAVQRRVQERAERRGLARHARVAAVERVADGADDEGDAAGDPPALQDQHGGDDAQREAR